MKNIVKIGLATSILAVTGMSFAAGATSSYTPATMPSIVTAVAKPVSVQISEAIFYRLKSVTDPLGDIFYTPESDSKQSVAYLPVGQFTLPVDFNVGGLAGMVDFSCSASPHQTTMHCSIVTLSHGGLDQPMTASIFNVKQLSTPGTGKFQLSYQIQFTASIV